MTNLLWILAGMPLIAVLLAWATAAAARSKDLDILDGPVKG